MPTDPTMETLLAQLQSQPNVTPEQAVNLRFTLERVVTVEDAMKAAVAEDRLKGFDHMFEAEVVAEVAAWRALGFPDQGTKRRLVSGPYLAIESVNRQIRG
jgi:hypothetical protein